LGKNTRTELIAKVEDEVLEKLQREGANSIET